MCLSFLDSGSLLRIFRSKLLDLKSLLNYASFDTLTIK